MLKGCSIKVDIIAKFVSETATFRAQCSRVTGVKLDYNRQLNTDNNTLHNGRLCKDVSMQVLESVTIDATMASPQI